MNPKAQSNSLFTSAVELHDRVIGDVAGTDGPIVVFFGGIHGNEPSGVLAIQRAFELLRESKVQIKGRVIGLAGNLPALAANKRFIYKDLNRIWNTNFATRFRSDASSNNGQVVEFHEQDELFEIIEPFLNSDTTSYFLDLHTTSSESGPFIAINDQLDNRRFALQFPVATVLGIEEYLDGPLLSYLNEFGHVALAFEAGQHQDPKSIDLHVAFILESLVIAGGISDDTLRKLKIDDSRTENSLPQSMLESASRSERGIYEVIHRQAIVKDDGFNMKTGYKNFNPIDKGDTIANDNLGPILAPRSGRIFMPLYQGSGNDGFFIVRKVPMWALKLSTLLRRINFERFLLLLPGVSCSADYPDALIVNQKVAFLLATEIFHLLGYRRKKKDGSRLIFSRREIAS